MRTISCQPSMFHTVVEQFFELLKVCRLTYCSLVNARRDDNTKLKRPKPTHKRPDGLGQTRNSALHSLLPKNGSTRLFLYTRQEYEGLW